MFTLPYCIGPTITMYKCIANYKAPNTAIGWSLFLKMVSDFGVVECSDYQQFRHSLRVPKFV
jgi:hypothetical protein